jgi:nitrogen fixation protein FixH
MVEVESCVNQGNKYHAANYTAKGVVDMTKLIWAFVDTMDDASKTPPKVTLLLARTASSSERTHVLVAYVCTYRAANLAHFLLTALPSKMSPRSRSTGTWSR